MKYAGIAVASAFIIGILFFPRYLASSLYSPHIIGIGLALVWIIFLICAIVEWLFGKTKKSIIFAIASAVSLVVLIILFH